MFALSQTFARQRPKNGATKIIEKAIASATCIEFSLFRWVVVVSADGSYDCGVTSVLDVSISNVLNIVEAGRKLYPTSVWPLPPFV